MPLALHSPPTISTHFTYVQHSCQGPELQPEVAKERRMWHLWQKRRAHRIERRLIYKQSLTFWGTQNSFPHDLASLQDQVFFIPLPTS